MFLVLFFVHEMYKVILLLQLLLLSLPSISLGGFILIKGVPDYILILKRCNVNNQPVNQCVFHLVKTLKVGSLQLQFLARQRTLQSGEQHGMRKQMLLCC